MPTIDVIIKAMNKIESHATSDVRSSCMMHALRFSESSALWPSDDIPSTKEGLLWVAANYGQKEKHIGSH